MTETKRITHSSQNGNQEQTARRCQEPELEEGKKKRQDESNHSRAQFHPFPPADLRLHRRNTLQRRQSINTNGAATAERFRCR